MEEKRKKHPFWIYETIMGAPDILSTWLEPEARAKVDHVAEQIVKRKPQHIFLSGTGSSYFAAIAQAYSFNQIAGIPASAFVRSELMTYPPKHFDKNSILIFNTHSGKSPGDVKLIELARDRGLYTVGITDISDSPFAQAVDDVIIGKDGPKHEMPSTRSYSSALFRVFQLTISCARRTGSAYIAKEHEEKLEQVPELMESFLSDFDTRAAGIVQDLKDQKAFFVIGAGPNMSTAYEGAMGLTQGTGKPAAGYNVDEYIHGPIQSLSNDNCVIAIASQGPLEKSIGKFIRTARLIGAKTVLCAPEGSSILGEGDLNITLPDNIPEVLTPAFYCVPFWLIGYYFSISNGLDPDNLSMEKETFKRSGLAELKKEIY